MLVKQCITINIGVGRRIIIGGTGKIRIIKDRLIATSCQIISMKLGHFIKLDVFKTQILLDMINCPWIFIRIGMRFIIKWTNLSRNITLLCLPQLFPAYWHCIKHPLILVVEVLPSINKFLKYCNILRKSKSGI